MVWACIAACFHLFWDLQYLVFYNWIGQDGTADQERTESWFVASWMVMGDIDNRYKENNDTVYVLELFTVAFALPLALLFAWFTYMQRPPRMAVGMFACGLQIYHAMIYFATEAHSGFQHTTGSDTAGFWFGFVLVTFIRLMVPFPILVHCWQDIVKGTALLDEHRIPKEFRSDVETDDDSKQITTLESDVKDCAIIKHSREGTHENPAVVLELPDLRRQEANTMVGVALDKIDEELRSKPEDEEEALQFHSPYQHEGCVGEESTDDWTRAEDQV